MATICIIRAGEVGSHIIQKAHNVMLNRTV